MAGECMYYQCLHGKQGEEKTEFVFYRCYLHAEIRALQKKKQKKNKDSRRVKEKIASRGGREIRED